MNSCEGASGAIALTSSRVNRPTLFIGPTCGVNADSHHWAGLWSLVFGLWALVSRATGCLLALCMQFGRLAGESRIHRPQCWPGCLFFGSADLKSGRDVRSVSASIHTGHGATCDGARLLTPPQDAQDIRKVVGPDRRSFGGDRHPPRVGGQLTDILRPSSDDEPLR